MPGGTFTQLVVQNRLNASPSVDTVLTDLCWALVAIAWLDL